MVMIVEERRGRRRKRRMRDMVLLIKNRLMDLFG
jgi:hypothetical protein